MKHVDITATIYDKRGKIIAIGKNSYIKTHPKMKEYAIKNSEPYKQVLHAEIAALIKCKKNTIQDKD